MRTPVRRSSASLTAFLLLAILGPDVSVRAETKAHEIPFEIASNKPFVQVTVNGSKPLWFILDSGCAGTSVIAKESAEGIGLQGNDEQKTQLGAGEGVQVGVSSIRDVTLGVGGASMELAEARIFPLGHVSKFEGRTVDGLLGEDFFRRFVVEIDYTRERIRLIDPASFEPPAKGIAIPIDTQEGLPVAPSAITVRGETIRGRFVIDTGVRATLILFQPFSTTHRLHDATGSLINAIVGGGAGGETRGDIARIEAISIGASEFEKPVVIFSRDTVGVLASSDLDGIVGGELLRRAKVTWDYPHGRMILEPHASSASAFEYDMSGLFLVADSEQFDNVRILSVTKGTPAHAAGLKTGDEIVAIDNRRTPSLSLEEARRIFRSAGSRRLELRRDGRPVQVTLVTRRLV
jgi:Aspartyl protease/PDZ domain